MPSITVLLEECIVHCEMMEDSQYNCLTGRVHCALRDDGGFPV